jgi:hypothetical protein
MIVLWHRTLLDAARAIDESLILRRAAGGHRFATSLHWN